MIDFHTHPVLIQEFAAKYPTLRAPGRGRDSTIENGKLVKGSRQPIYFMEYDGPLERTYLVQVLVE